MSASNLQAVGVPPMERYLAAMRAEELPFRPNTRRYRLIGAMGEAQMPPLEFRMFMALVNARRPAARMAEFAQGTERRALAHLEVHGWISRTDGLSLLAGADCDCAAPSDGNPAANPMEARGCTALYRLYDTSGILLYIGITDALPDRMRQHAGVQPWWPEVARRTVAWYDDRDDAEAAETLAIAAEKPIHNKAKLYAPKAAAEF